MGPLRQTLEAPADDAIDRRDRSARGRLRESLALLGGELRSLARGFAINQPVDVLGIEPPVPDNLETHLATGRRHAATATIMDRPPRPEAGVGHRESNQAFFGKPLHRVTSNAD